jgi:hypothetical protein
MLRLPQSNDLWIISTYVLWNKLVSKDHILYDSINVKVQNTNPLRHEVVLQFPRIGGGRFGGQENREFLLPRQSHPRPFFCLLACLLACFIYLFIFWIRSCIFAHGPASNPSLHVAGIKDMNHHGQFICWEAAHLLLGCLQIMTPRSVPPVCWSELPHVTIVYNFENWLIQTENQYMPVNNF